MSFMDSLLSEEYCEDAIRKWVRIDILKQIPLQGGISGAEVSIVEALIRFPELEHLFKPKRIKCVVKLSGKDDFEKEKAVYSRLPDALKDFFVDFSVPGRRALVDNRYFMIMPHLEDYKTLAYHVYHGNRDERESSIKITLDRLDRLHAVDEASKANKERGNLGKLFSMYLGDIYTSVERIFSPPGEQIHILHSFLTTNKLTTSEFVANEEKIYPYSFYYKKIVKISEDLCPPFLTMCHGDCHSRNIMIHLAKPDLKFIDIDKLSRTGDYVLDFGTLIADLEAYNPLLQSRKPEFELTELGDKKYHYKFSGSTEIKNAVKSLEKHIDIVAGNTDEKWEKRLLVSKARYLLEMASKTLDVEKSFVTYCEGLRTLGMLVQKP